jgi:hypothetical protein
MGELQLQHVTEQWRLFTDSPKVSMTAILIYNGNKPPTVTLAHAVNMKESYINIQSLLKNKMCYEHHE